MSELVGSQGVFMETVTTEILSGKTNYNIVQSDPESVSILGYTAYYARQSSLGTCTLYSTYHNMFNFLSESQINKISIITLLSTILPDKIRNLEISRKKFRDFSLKSFENALSLLRKSIKTVKS